MMMDFEVSQEFFKIQLIWNYKSWSSFETRIHQSCIDIDPHYFCLLRFWMVSRSPQFLQVSHSKTKLQMYQPKRYIKKKSNETSYSTFCLFDGHFDNIYFSFSWFCTFHVWIIVNFSFFHFFLLKTS